MQKIKVIQISEIFLCKKKICYCSWIKKKRFALADNKISPNITKQVWHLKFQQRNNNIPSFSLVFHFLVFLFYMFHVICSFSFTVLKWFFCLFLCLYKYIISDFWVQQDCKLRHILLRCNTCKYMYKRNSTWLGLIPSYSHRLYPIIQHPSSKNTSAQKQPSTFTPPRTSLSPSPFSLSALSESEWSPVNFAARLQLQALTSQWHHSCPLKSVKHPGLEFLPPSPEPPLPGSDAEIEKHNVGWADREGGEKERELREGGWGLVVMEGLYF